MTQLYKSETIGRILYLDEIPADVITKLDQFVAARKRDYQPGVLQSWFEHPSTGIMISAEDLDYAVEDHLSIFAFVNDCVRKTGLIARSTPMEGVVEFWVTSMRADPVTSHSAMFNNQDYFEDSDCAICLMVTRKDDTFHGGNLEVDLNTKSFWEMLFTSEDYQMMEVPLKRGSVLVMDGGMYHQFMKAAGTGEMHVLKVCVVLQNS